MRETARSAHVWGKGWETALAVPQEESGKMAENRMAQGMQPGAFRLGFRLQICLGARGGVRDLLSGDRAEFGFPLAPAGGCAVFFQ